MRNVRADFWREASRSLPTQVQARYRAYFEAAERWELAWDNAVELAGRIKQRVARRLETHPA